MPTTAQRQEITRFAEEYYDENRDALVASLAEQIEHSIAIGEAQLKSGCNQGTVFTAKCE